MAQTDRGRIHVTIRVCSDDAALQVVQLNEHLNEKLKISTVDMIASCSKDSDPIKVNKGIIGVIETTKSAVYLTLETPQSDTEPRQTRKRLIPWNTDVKRPIEETLSKNKSTAFALLIESLLLDFMDIALTAEKYPLSPAPDTSTGTPPDDAETHAPQDQTLAREIPAASAKKRVVGATIAASGGFVIQSEDAALAPRIDLDAGLTFRWLALLIRGYLETDSNMEIERRPLDTRVVGVSLGLRGIVSRLGPLAIALSGAVVLRFYSVKRENYEAAKPRKWLDVGMGAYFQARYDITPVFSLFFQPGLEFFPFARVVRIPVGPQKEIGKICVPVSMGFAASF